MEVSKEWKRKFEHAHISFVFTSKSEELEAKKDLEWKSQCHATYANKCNETNEINSCPELENDNLVVSTRLGKRNGEEAEVENDDEVPFGAAYARNRAVAQSSGAYLCMLDADDIMMPRRVELQLAFALNHPDYLIGCKFTRLPENSTPRYCQWYVFAYFTNFPRLNNMSAEELYTHRFRENTLIQPTFFLSRITFNKIGGYIHGKGFEFKVFYFSIS